jgi:hypothetical protein
MTCAGGVLFPDVAEEGAQLAGEQPGLLERREVPADRQLVPVPDVRAAPGPHSPARLTYCCAASSS